MKQLLLTLFFGVFCNALLSQLSQSQVDQFQHNNVYIMKHFISQIEGLPENFEPTSIMDFAPYVPSSLDLDEIQVKLDENVDYVNQYTTYYSQQELIDNNGYPPGDFPVSFLPKCFSTWYYTEIAIGIELTLCCVLSGGAGCAVCVGAAAALEATNNALYEDCIENCY